MKPKEILTKVSLLWIIGVFQPISVDELLFYLDKAFHDKDILLDSEAIRKFCEQQMKSGHLIKVAWNPDIFSLTAEGNSLFSMQSRISRDKVRFFLLKKSHNDRLRMSREELASRLGDDSPPLDERCSTKMTDTKSFGQSYWYRFSKQLAKETGSSQTSRDTYNYLPLLSFFNKKQLAIAMGVKNNDFKINFNTLGLMLGVSPKLLSIIAHEPESHYRKFYLKKKGGGERLIESPKLFLKIIQQFLNDYFILNDYFLFKLPQHDCVHSFRAKHSIVSHAKLHTRKKYVANIDIEDFFGSISHSLVIKHLQKYGVDEVAAKCITRLCTKDGALPQGAPTSPTISNSILFEFDKKINNECEKLELTYSRYADDITISGQDRQKILKVIKLASELLESKYKLKLNNEKTRIASEYSQQRVTGVVVNEGVRPPRVFRRNLRAKFHNTKKKGEITEKEERHLRGYISYLRSYPDISIKEIERYTEVLKNIKVIEEKKPKTESKG